MRTQEEITAYHEAGHAVMAMSCGFVVTRISIRPDVSSLGRTAYGIPGEMADEVRRKDVLVACGGLAADFIHFNVTHGSHDDEVALGHFGDQEKAHDHLSVLGESDHFNTYLAVTIRYLTTPERWRIVEEVAYILLGAGAIDGVDLLRRWSQACPLITGADLTHLSALIETARHYQM